MQDGVHIDTATEPHTGLPIFSLYGDTLEPTADMVSNTPITNLDMPEYAVTPENRIPVSDYPSKMKAIPPSRMFTIKEALATYKKKAGDDAPVYDASQGDGGASLPGVPEYILREAAELQIKHVPPVFAGLLYVSLL